MNTIDPAADAALMKRLLREKRARLRKLIRTVIDENHGCCLDDAKDVARLERALLKALMGERV